MVLFLVTMSLLSLNEAKNLLLWLCSEEKSLKTEELTYLENRRKRYGNSLYKSIAGFLCSIRKVHIDRFFETVIECTRNCLEEDKALVIHNVVH